MTLEQRIAARLTEAAMMCDRTGVELAAPPDGKAFCLAVHGHPYAGTVALMSMGEVAQLAADEARRWF